MPKKHFIAYHNVAKMGGHYAIHRSLAGCSFHFLTKKKHSAVNAFESSIWVVEGRKNGRKKQYVLVANFKVDCLQKLGNQYHLFGNDGSLTQPQVDITELPWFKAFLRKQANFSLGLNQI